ncbi:MAG TPA: UDP-2,3-diacylglucosamine diphosphatase LpxI [Alphaproteobacteria bacterium]|nr:UDP-2,3-diacylglucosamine diphosphatase LpxI [Alphaproteobacteria bacterium]USO06145.1 MAG: UDP-2,3-diacylglucosamine diphosphatase LpxI [Rhodospirillales bacterium]HOO82522.1 UDP-2,3-diacylglucosamine diphosphatase LpxI [Alphaproteobacteria bacterium]
MSAAEEKCLEGLSRIGIIAGGGALPRMLIAACQDRGIEPFIVAFEGQTDPETPDGLDHIWVHLGATRKVIRTLRKSGIRDLVMLGSIRRPSLSELKPDFKTVEFFAKEGWKSLGDDSLLRALRRFLEGEGFTLHGAQEFIPELLAPEGVIGRIKPHAAQRRDIARGIEVLKALSRQDVGQAAVVQNGHVLGIEGAEGTDGLIRRCGDLKRKGHGAVLVKLCKDTQDQDLDLPTIGPHTVDNIIQSGFSGLAVHAGKSFISQIDDVREKADSAGVFVIGISL